MKILMTETGLLFSFGRCISEQGGSVGEEEGGS